MANHPRQCGCGNYDAAGYCSSNTLIFCARSSLLRADLAAARRQWLKEVIHDTDQYARRQESDFLVDKNHEGERIDFHALRTPAGFVRC